MSQKGPGTVWDMFFEREGAAMARPEEKDRAAAQRRAAVPDDPFIRAENEDDDGYDPYSDRRPEPEPLFERDPWG